MNFKSILRNGHGFTLVELLVVIAIMGLAMTAILGLFTDTQQTANTQEEVANTQQNLRIAMNFLTRDIQMAGFLIPTTNTAIESAPANLSGGQILTIRTATTSLDVARVASSVTVTNAPSSYVTFTLAKADMVDLFESGDKVRLVRSPLHDQRIDTLLEVGTSPSSTTLNIKGFNADATYNQADLLVKTSSAHPSRIDYDINNNILRRSIDGGGFDEISENITSVDFNYIINFGEIIAVRVTLTGNAFDVKRKTQKSRQLVKLVSLKNI
jgi:prepilin-type N-terminal cleavage/methylation domain-containing protein